jgi:transposase
MALAGCLADLSHNPFRRGFGVPEFLSSRLPKLGTLEGKQVASLAGLALMSRQSSKWQGKERIQGGRTFLRRAIYMPALVATRYNPDFKAKYDQLIRAGKPGKVAIAAIMRKLIVMANALLRDGLKWSEIMP